MSAEVDKELAEKVMQVLGEQYDEALEVGQHPFCFFAQEHLECYMHRVKIKDPDEKWDLPQHYYVFLADNPIGDFRLSPTQPLPPFLTLSYARHKKTERHLPIRELNAMREKKRDEYEVHDVILTRRQIELILRIAANWDNIEPDSQEEILEQFKI